MLPVTDRHDLHHNLKENPMAKMRKRVSKKKSRRLFSKTSGTHKKNLNEGIPMRGGIRL